MRHQDALAKAPTVDNAARHTRSAPAMVVAALDKLDAVPRAHLLSRLVGAVGPLALAVLGGGVFAKYLVRARWPEISVSLEDATRITTDQLWELVRYVDQSNPHMLDTLMSALAHDGIGITAIGISVLAMVIRNGPDRESQSVARSD